MIVDWADTLSHLAGPHRAATRAVVFGPDADHHWLGAMGDTPLEAAHNLAQLGRTGTGQPWTQCATAAAEVVALLYAADRKPADA